MKKLILKQVGDTDFPYQVVGIVNTIEWDIKEPLSRKDVEQILARRGVHAIKVEVK